MQKLTIGQIDNLSNRFVEIYVGLPREEEQVHRDLRHTPARAERIKYIQIDRFTEAMKQSIDNEPATVPIDNDNQQAPHTYPRTAEVDGTEGNKSFDQGKKTPTGASNNQNGHVADHNDFETDRNHNEYKSTSTANETAARGLTPSGGRNDGAIAPIVAGSETSDGRTPSGEVATTTTETRDVTLTTVADNRPETPLEKAAPEADPPERQVQNPPPHSAEPTTTTTETRDVTLTTVADNRPESPPAKATPEAFSPERQVQNPPPHSAEPTTTITETRDVTLTTVADNRPESPPAKATPEAVSPERQVQNNPPHPPKPLMDTKEKEDRYAKSTPQRVTPAKRPGEASQKTVSPEQNTEGK